MSAGLPGVAGPFAASGLDALLTIAARNSPDSILLRDDAGEADAATLARRVRRLAGQLRFGGLRGGERVLILAGPEIAAIVALIATLRAGLDPVVVPCAIGAVELAAAARAAGAAAMIGPSHHAGRDLGDCYLSAAAVNETIRGLLTFGPAPVDGASDVSAAALDAEPPGGLPPGLDEGATESAAIATLAGPPTAPRLAFHSQAVLFADALSLVEQAGILPSHALISLLPPCTLAGLVAGPFAAFAGASRLALHGPFDAGRFLRRCDAETAYHLVVPAAAAAPFAAACLGTGLTSLVAVSRHAAGFTRPPDLTPETRCVDLFAFGEDTVLAQSRRGGVAEAPRRVPDRSGLEGLGARLHRARVEERAQAEERPQIEERDAPAKDWPQQADALR